VLVSFLFCVCCTHYCGIGLAEQLVQGLGILRSLNEQSSGSLDSYSTPIRNCDQHAVTNNPLSTVVNRSSLVMKPSLLCLGGHITIPVGGTNGITLPLLYQSKLTPPASSDDYIKPRTLFSRAQEVVKNGKKALACVMAQDSPYKDYIKTGNLPSGMNHDDYLQFLQEKMYFALNPSKIVDVVNADSIASTMLGNTTIDVGNNDGADVAAAKLFTFPGYIVLTLMGPIVEDFDMLSLCSDLLMTSTCFQQHHREEASWTSESPTTTAGVQTKASKLQL